MKIISLLNENLHLISPCSVYEAWHRKGWVINGSSGFCVTNAEIYYKNLEEIYLSDKFIAENFSRKTIYKKIDEILTKKKISDSVFHKDDSDSIFSNEKKSMPKKIKVIAPISGVGLDNEHDKFDIGVFDFPKMSQLSPNLSIEDEGIYIGVEIQDVYDQLISIERAEHAFLDFIRIINFLSGRVDKAIKIKTGLPRYPDYFGNFFYRETKSYHLFNIETNSVDQFSVENTSFEKVPLDNSVFYNHPGLSKVWDFYSQKHLNKKMKDFHRRIINSVLAIGESMRNENPKISIFYTCIALETLLSRNENDIFSRSIGEKLADAYSFIIGTDAKTRISSRRLIKSVYGMRSALIHGGDKNIKNDYIAVNSLLRLAISKLLNVHPYNSINHIDQLYDMISKAQNSYSVDV